MTGQFTPDHYPEDWVEDAHDGDYGPPHYRFACPECGQNPYAHPFGGDRELLIRLECPDCGIDTWFDADTHRKYHYEEP